MYKYTAKYVRMFVIISVLILTFGVTTSFAQQKMKVMGIATAAMTEEKMFEIGDVEGHMMTLSKDEGVNVSKGPNPFMDGAMVINLSYNDNIKGIGKHSTYVQFSKMNDAVIAKCEGKSTMTTTPDGTPMINIEGTFSWIKGTGKFENIQGNGTYKGMYISRTIWTLDWQGEYFIKMK